MVLRKPIAFIAAFSLLMNLVFVFVYFSMAASTSEALAPTLSVTADLITAQGPLAQAWQDHTNTFRDFVFQIITSTHHYGMLRERNIDYSAKDVIIKYPSWLKFYRGYRLSAWNGRETVRLAEGKSFPD